MKLDGNNIYGKALVKSNDYLWINISAVAPNRKIDYVSITPVNGNVTLTEVQEVKFKVQNSDTKDVFVNFHVHLK